VDAGALLSFEKPSGGRVIVASPEKILFDSVVDSEEIYAPPGSCVFCAGEPGDVLKVIAQ